MGIGSSDISCAFIFEIAQKLLESARALHLVIKAYFDSGFKLAFSSQDVLGFLVSTAMHPHGINAALVSLDREKVRLFGEPIVTGDELLILEIVEGFSARNLGTAENWLSAK